MAINYLNKLFESTANSDPNTVTFGAAVPANSLVIVALIGRRTTYTLPALISVTDSQGNTYENHGVRSADKGTFLAYCRTPVSLSTSDTLTVDWNGTLSDSWISGHAFDNAAGDEYHYTGTGGPPASGFAQQVTVNVTGSDWLTFGCFYLPNNSSATITPVNSSLSRDTTTNAFGECFSRNGTTGTTHTIGGTTTTGVTWLGIAASFLYDPSGSGNKRYQPTVIGV